MRFTAEGFYATFRAMNRRVLSPVVRACLVVITLLSMVGQAMAAPMVCCTAVMNGSRDSHQEIKPSIQSDMPANMHHQGSTHSDHNRDSRGAEQLVQPCDTHSANNADCEANHDEMTSTCCDDCSCPENACHSSVMLPSYHVLQSLRVSDMAQRGMRTSVSHGYTSSLYRPPRLA